MKNRTLTFAGGVAAGVAISLGVAGLGASDGSAPGALEAPHAHAADSRTVMLSKELGARAKLETARISNQTMSPTLQLVGSVAFDANRVAEVGGRIEGRVTRMLVTIGDVVKKGQPLCELESNELGMVLSDLLGARANLIAAEHNEKRESALFEQQLASAPVVERARAEVKALRATLHGAEQRLLAMGLSPRELDRIGKAEGPRRITLRAPLDGEVVARYAVLGQVVSPTQPVLRIADLDQLWVELDVSEHDLAHAAEGNEVEIASETYPDKTFRGRVAHMDATVDLATRTAGVRIEVSNEERLLRPGQFVTARLSTSGPGHPSLRIPRKAILQVEGQPSVFLVAGKQQYVARSIELGTEAGDWIEVTRGLVEGDTIVTAGAFALKSELLR
jgi:cobalt-zinc-cadmium efflux system membrane fusion protein